MRSHCLQKRKKKYPFYGFDALTLSHCCVFVRSHRSHAIQYVISVVAMAILAFLSVFAFHTDPERFQKPLFCKYPL